MCICDLEWMDRWMNEWKADRPHPRDYPHTPIDYRNTDNHLRLVMGAVALCCTRQSRAPNIDHCALEIWCTLPFDLDPWPWPWPSTLTPTFDLKASKQWCKTQFLVIWPWPMTLTKVDPHRKKQGQRPNGSARRGHTDRQTDKRTDRWTLPSTLSPTFAVDNEWSSSSLFWVRIHVGNVKSYLSPQMYGRSLSCLLRAPSHTFTLCFVLLTSCWSRTSTGTFSLWAWNIGR